MKKILVLVFLVLGGLTVQAQIDTKKALKTATRALTKFNLDNTDMENLETAKTAIMQVLDAPGMENDANALKILGDVYNAYINLDVAASILDPNRKAEYPDAPEMAFDAYSKAVKNAEKGKVLTQSIDGLMGTIQGLSQGGINKFQEGDYAAAYKSFEKVLKVNEIVTANGGDPVLDEANLNNQMYLAGLSAIQAGDMDKAKMQYGALKERGYNEPELYDGLYKITFEEDEEKALAYLAEGREKFPDELNLLYTEINHYLRAGNLLELESKLETAISKDPKNVSLYTTLGNIYDKAFQEKNKEGEKEKAQEYFDKALNKFEQAIEIDPSSSDAIYSIGALYYNKAAYQSQQLEELANDYSAAGIKKYDAKKSEVDAIFDQALPFFQKAEKVNPNDRNTLIALKEIYARKNELDKSEEFKKRIETIEAGGTNSTSYFKD